MLSRVVQNLPWVVIWVVALAVQERFLRRKNGFGALIVLWLTLVIGVFWNKAIGALVPGVSEMWLFGTKIWLLFLVLALRHYFNLRKDRRLRAAKPAEPAPEAPDPEEQETTEE